MCYIGLRHWGLSPRVRGNQRREAGASGAGGSIPAGAGEPGSAAGDKTEARVYPRGCGGTMIADHIPAVAAGLSPRVRGNHIANKSRGMVTGSIPAGAGEP